MLSFVASPSTRIATLWLFHGPSQRSGYRPPEQRYTTLFWTETPEAAPSTRMPSSHELTTVLLVIAVSRAPAT